ncbi:MAG: DMT family transporter [Sphingomonas sp.]
MPRFVIVALTALAILAFAGNSLLTRAALGAGLIGPGPFAAIRLAAGAAVLLPVILPGLLRGDRPQVDVVAVGSLLVYTVAFSFAYRSLGAGAGAMILFAAVQSTIAVVGLVRGVPIGGRALAGICTALAGLAYLVSARGIGAVSLGPALLMVAAGMAWGGYTLAGRRTTDPTRATALNFLLAAPLAVPFVLMGGGVPVERQGVLLAVCAGALTSGIGYGIWYAVAPRLGHATIGAVQLATPVVAALGGALLLGETVTARLSIAAALIFGGIVLTISPNTKRRAPAR